MPNGVTILTDSEIKALPYMLTAEQAAAVLGVCRRTVYYHVERGDLPVHRMGGAYRFAKPEVLSYAGLWHLIDPAYWDGIEGAARILERYRGGVNGGVRPRA